MMTLALALGIVMIIISIVLFILAGVKFGQDRDEAQGAIIYGAIALILIFFGSFPIGFYIDDYAKGVPEKNSCRLEASVRYSVSPVDGMFLFTTLNGKSRLFAIDSQDIFGMTEFPDAFVLVPFDNKIDGVCRWTVYSRLSN